MKRGVIFRALKIWWFPSLTWPKERKTNNNNIFVINKSFCWLLFFEIKYWFIIMYMLDCLSITNTLIFEKGEVALSVFHVHSPSVCQTLNREDTGQWQHQSGSSESLPTPGCVPVHSLTCSCLVNIRSPSGFHRGPEITVTYSYASSQFQYFTIINCIKYCDS